MRHRNGPDNWEIRDMLRSRRWQWEEHTKGISARSLVVVLFSQKGGGLRLILIPQKFFSYQLWAWQLWLIKTCDIPAVMEFYCSSEDRRRKEIGNKGTKTWGKHQEVIMIWIEWCDCRWQWLPYTEWERKDSEERLFKPGSEWLDRGSHVMRSQAMLMFMKWE